MSPHFHRLCPPPHSSSPFHHIVPISSLAWMSPLLLHCLPPVQPLSWIFLIAHVLHLTPLPSPRCPLFFFASALRCTHLHPSVTSFPSLCLPGCPPFSCTAFHQSNPSVGSFSSPMSSTAIIFTLPSLHFPPLRFPGCPPIFITYVLCCTCLRPSVPSSPPSLHLPRFPALPSTTPTSRLDHFMPISSTALIFALPLLRFPPLHLSGCPPFSCTAFYHSKP